MAKRKFWERLIAEFERSGLTHAEFSKRRKVSIHALRDWLYRLRAERRRGRSRRAARRLTPARSPELIELVPRVPARVSVWPMDRDVVEARVGGVAVRFLTGSDPGYLAVLLRDLDGRC